jgi:predicted DNA-binding transcriptional regulator AlpA
MAREPYATADEVCEYYRISKQTLYNWRAAGLGPKATKIGGQRLRFLWRDVEAYAQRADARAGGEAA